MTTKSACDDQSGRREQLAILTAQEAVGCIKEMLEITDFCPACRAVTVQMIIGQLVVMAARLQGSAAAGKEALVAITHAYDDAVRKSRQ